MIKINKFFLLFFSFDVKIVTYFIGIVPLFILRKFTKKEASKVIVVSNDSVNDDNNKKSLTSNIFIQLLMQFGGQFKSFIT